MKKSINNYFAKKKWYSILSDGVFVVLVVLLLIPQTRSEVASFFIRLTSLPPSTNENEQKVNIALQTAKWQLFDINGEKVNFEELNNKPVFLNFWATWCPPCIAEMPGIKELYQQFGDDINFVIVSNESRAQVREFAKNKDFFDLPFYQNKDVPSVFSSESIPTTFVIDRKGNIVLAKTGVARWNSGRVVELLTNLIDN